MSKEKPSVKYKAKRALRELRSGYYTACALRKVKRRGPRCKCNAKCRFTSKTELGENCNFNGMEVTGRGLVRIGNNFHSGKDCTIMTSYHNYDHGARIPYDDTFITRDVVIGDNVWIGQSVIILAGSHIGDGAVIQAGSVVCGDIPPLAVAGGHPAKPFKYRDKEHYDQCLREGLFF